MSKHLSATSMMEKSPIGAAELTVVVPTHNERDNVRPLYEHLKIALRDIAWEAIFVDDESSDGTSQLLLSLAKDDARVRIVERIHRSGLATAIVEGMMASSSPFIAVIDCDLQHDEKLLPKMLAELRGDTTLDVVIGSRHVEGGGIVDWSKWRQLVSKVGKIAVNLILPPGVHDPMSGFFMLRREFLWQYVGNLTGRGFKILVDLLHVGRKTCHFKEIPYQFRARTSGESKLDARAVGDLFVQIIDHLIGRVIPIEFLLFVIVGLVGLLVHGFILYVCYRLIEIPFVYSQISSALTTMAFNYYLNNVITFRGRQWKGRGVFIGLLIFYAFCSFGLVVSVSVSLLLIDFTHSWLLSGIIGALFGGVWNYSTNNSLNWRSARN
jgi:dolichol-phosphate mannosyltransferase